ncbi:MAG: hypothetical protein KEFWMYNX_000662, partial [Candidatus Fervidibacter sp.]
MWRTMLSIAVLALAMALPTVAQEEPQPANWA